MLLTAAKALAKLTWHTFRAGMRTTAGKAVAYGSVEAAGAGLEIATGDHESTWDAVKSALTPIPVEIGRYLLKEAPRIRQQRFMEAVPQLVARQGMTAGLMARHKGVQGQSLELLDLAIVPKQTPAGVVRYPTALLQHGDKSYVLVMVGGKYRSKLAVMDYEANTFLNKRELPPDMQRFIYELCELAIATMPEVR